jgi:hypothetical protein
MGSVRPFLPVFDRAVADWVFVPFVFRACSSAFISAFTLSADSRILWFTSSGSSNGGFQPGGAGVMWSIPFSRKLMKFLVGFDKSLASFRVSRPAVSSGTRLGLSGFLVLMLNQRLITVSQKAVSL